MREILFKAKVIDTGEWIEGIPIKTHIGLFMCFDENPHYCNQYGYMEIDKIIKVDESTLCQYTGLNDKNGNKIWEKDVVHLFGKDTLGKYDWKAVVEFGNPNSLYSWGYQLKPIGHFEYNEDILCWVGMEEANIYCEVIGNIFDNPDLMKGE